MKRIMYIECKDGKLEGPGRIGWVERAGALARSALASDLRADGRGSQSRERARLTNEMRLIGISRLDCDVGRSRWLRCARQTQETLKSQNAIKCLRPVAEILAAASE